MGYTTDSAFGVEHEVSKAAGSEADEAAKAFLKAPKFKPVKPGVKLTGPGSLRAKLDPTTSHRPAAAARKAP